MKILREYFIFKSAIILVFILSGCDSPGKKGKNGEKAEQKPNVIFVLADQWRAQATGYGGNKDIITPNLDSLAHESIVFNTATAVMPVCTPYRASLLTGQFPLSHGVFYNDKPLPNEALTMAEIYKEAGYRTGYVGKWHLNGHEEGESPFAGRDRPVLRDRRQGFDYWKVREVNHHYNDSYYFDEADGKQQWKGYDAFPQTDSAISFIEQKEKDPFLLFLSWGPPHDPYFSAPQEFKDLYNPKEIRLRPNVPDSLENKARKNIANYYAHCSALDHALGKLLKAVDKAGIADNTIFVFTSDHGDMLFSQGARNKQRPYDESLLVPMLLRYPARLGNETREINGPVNTPDILPTLLGLSGIKTPSLIEGKDFSDALLSKDNFENQAALVMQPVPFHQWNFKKGGVEYRAVRTERYTYARKLNAPWLLYDNQKDPYQQNNLIGNKEYAEIEMKLDKVLDRKLKETGDKFLPADYYMKEWGYRYDFEDSLRPPSYHVE